MKNQESIKKLQLLKTMQPTKFTLKRIREDVSYHLQSGNKKHVYPDIADRFNNFFASTKFSGIATYANVIAFVLIIFLFASILLLPNQIHAAILYGRLALASNQYEKARIAFNDTKIRFADNKTAQENNELAQSLTLTNTQLNDLQLKGEKGKYTAQACHQIYQEYLSYLEDKEKGIQSNNQTLKSQINLFEEQAEKKLHMYKLL